MKRDLGFDKQGIKLTMTQKDFWGYGVGVAGVSVIAEMIGQLSFFYTDKVGLTAGLAGSAIMIARIVDAFTDLVMGVIVDRTKSKYGRARPWMLWMALPAFAAVASLLLIPSGWSDQAKFVYALVSNIFASAVIGTAVSVPYACLLNFRTQSQYERTRMNVHRTIVNYVLGMFFSTGLVPITKAMGGTQTSWIIVGLILAAMAASMMVICFFSTKEMEESADLKAQKTEKFFTQVKMLFKNRYWIIMALTMLTASVVYGFTGATNAYYAKWIFGSESIVGIMGLIGIFPTLLGFVIVSPLVKRFGPLTVIKSGFIIGIVGYAIRAAFPYNFAVVCASGALTSFSTLPYMMTGMVLVANVADFEEWRTGQKKVGLVNTATSFGNKVGKGVSAGLIGLVLSWGGYNAKAAAQTPGAITSIFAVSIYIPATLLAILLILMLAYDMDKRYPNFRKELVEKRKQKVEG